MKNNREHGAGNLSFLTIKEQKRQHLRQVFWTGMLALTLALVVVIGQAITRG